MSHCDEATCPLSLITLIAFFFYSQLVWFKYSACKPLQIVCKLMFCRHRRPTDFLDDNNTQEVVLFASTLAIMLMPEHCLNTFANKWNTRFIVTDPELLPSKYFICWLTAAPWIIISIHARWYGWINARSKATLVLLDRFRCVCLRIYCKNSAAWIGKTCVAWIVHRVELLWGGECLSWVHNDVKKFTRLKQTNFLHPCRSLLPAVHMGSFLNPDQFMDRSPAAGRASALVWAFAPAERQ